MWLSILVLDVYRPLSYLLVFDTRDPLFLSIFLDWVVENWCDLRGGGVVIFRESRKDQFLFRIVFTLQGLSRENCHKLVHGICCRFIVSLIWIPMTCRLGSCAKVLRLSWVGWDTLQVCFREVGLGMQFEDWVDQQRPRMTTGWKKCPV